MIPLCPQAARERHRENKRHSYTLYTKTPFRSSCSCVRAEGHKLNCANDRPCMPNWAAFVRHKATYVKLFPIYILHHFHRHFWPYRDSKRIESSRACTPQKTRAQVGIGVQKKRGVNKQHNMYKKNPLNAGRN